MRRGRKQLYRIIYERFITNDVYIAIFLFLSACSLVIIPGWMKSKYADNNFLENIFVEAHGMLFDLLVIGIFLTWLIKRGQKTLDIKRYLEEIDDFRGWHSEEAARRIRGNIYRLNSLGFTAIDLSGCYLKGMNLVEVNLRHAILLGTNLEGATLWDSDFRKASLGGANLRNSSLKGVNLEGAYCWETDFRGVADISMQQLLATNNMYAAKVDNNIEINLKKVNPDALGPEEPVTTKDFIEERLKLIRDDPRYYIHVK